MKGIALILTGALVLVGAAIGVNTAQAADSDKGNQNAASSAFGFDLFKQVLKQDRDKNVFVSPTSVSLALSMVYNGAEGQTRQVMAKTLNLKDASIDGANKANAALIEFLATPEPGLKLEIANSLWTRENVAIKPEFIQRNRDSFRADVFDLDFADPSAPTTINNWVNKRTQSKITRLVDRIDSAQVMIAVNAVYFKGTWTDPFDPKWTRNESFSLADGKTKPVPMMCRNGNYSYYKGPGFSAVSIPYGKGKMSMYVFLPDEGTKLSAFLDGLNPKSFDEWVSNFSAQQVLVMLPKFKIEYGVALNDSLVAMGMGEAFSKGANFSGISSTPLWIGQVVHKTYVNVDEEGTEAAAATGVFMAAGPRPQFVEFKVDRPFFCVIRDNKTGEMLFMGTVVDPTE